MTTNRSTMGTRFVNRQMTLVDAVPIMVLDLEGALLRIGRGDVVDQLRKVSLERWSYDETADAAYLYVRSPGNLDSTDENIAGEKPGETVSLYDELGINLDLDDQKRLVGVEILGAGYLVEQLAGIAK